MKQVKNSHADRESTFLNVNNLIIYAVTSLFGAGCWYSISLKEYQIEANKVTIPVV